MKRNHVFAPLILLLIALIPSVVAAQTHMLQLEAPPRPDASPECSLGVKYDDGTFSNGYSIGSGPGASSMVMKFTLPAGTTGIDQVCSCFSRFSASPSSMNYDVVVYDDNGPAGAPGTLLGSVTVTANDIPVLDSRFYTASLSSSSIALPADLRVFVGVRWQGGSIFLCGDRPPTAQQLNYGSSNQGASWTNLTTLFPTSPPVALGVRVDPLTPTCTPTAKAMCLGGGRFKVEATYATSSASGQADAVRLTDDTGYLWFFSSTNVETVIKVLNACPVNNRFWVFAGGLTDQRVDLKVTDTKTGAVRTYINPIGTPFQPIQDTSAFATCP